LAILSFLLLKLINGPSSYFLHDESVTVTIAMAKSIGFIVKLVCFLIGL
jgi:hypothetical protein